MAMPPTLNGSSMAYKYNPGFLNDQGSIRSFVVRHKDLRIVSEVLTDNAHASANRHVLVIGPRGSGKSTLARRLIAEVKTNPALASSWYPIILGEESYTITSAGEFWLECVFQLVTQLGRADLDKQYREVQSELDDARLRERALGILVSFATEIGKRILLVVENFNMIMEDQVSDQEGWAIRHALHNVPEVMLFATATRKFDQIQNADRPLFEQFKVHELRPLGITDVTTLWTFLTKEGVLARKARPIQILTGGSPRLITILAEFAVNHSFNNLILRLTSLIDQYTDYFKSQLDSLAAAERKVFVTVLETWDPSTTREIAEGARMPVNVTSSNLNRLRTKGAVQRRSSNGVQFWEASERLFNIYYLMRRRGAPSSRVDALVRFMTVYYEQDQLYERATDLAKECSTLEPNLRQDHYHALAQLMRTFDGPSKARLLSLTPPDFSKHVEEIAGLSTHAPVGVRRGLFATRQRILDLVRSAKIDEATKLLESGAFTGKEHATLWAIVGISTWSVIGDETKARAVLAKALELDAESGLTWFFQGILLSGSDHYAEAAASFEKAIHFGRDGPDVWSALGDAYEEISNLPAAASSYREAVKRDGDLADAWHSLGRVLARSGTELSEAESALRKAVQLKPRELNYKGMLATFLLNERASVIEAQRLAREMLEEDSTHGRTWALLIRTLARADHSPEEIKSEFETALKALQGKPHWRVSSAYADYLGEIHEHDAAEQVLQEAVASSPDAGPAWVELAKHLATQDKKEAEALEAFKRALELLPDDPITWISFGEFLSKRAGHMREAEEALRKATELAPTRCSPWKALGEHLVKTDKVEEGFDSLRRAMLVNPRCFCAMDAYCSVLIKAPDGLSSVVSMIEDQIKKTPKNPIPHIVLARYLTAEGQDRQRAIENLLLALQKGASSSYLVPEFLENFDLSNVLDTIKGIEKFLDAAPNDEGDDRSADFAKLLYEKQVSSDLMNYAVSLARRAISTSPENWEFRWALAAVLFASKCFSEALVQIRWLADHITQRGLRQFIDLCISIARVDRDRLLEVLLASGRTEEFEPLVIALKLDIGGELNVAREVLEVAKDIHDQIFGDSASSLAEGIK